MSKRHDAVFDDILSDLPTSKPGEERVQARFLKRSNSMADQVSRERQEKVLRLVDPATCRMWARHNRAYELLTEENCHDLIEGIKSQGQQEFPAVVRRLPEGQGARYEVICGARRHFAISWLRANTYPQFKYLIEERELTDEEAFRLSDIENRDREDISDFERARDYARAIELYYGGKQILMAERLDVSAAWLSRYLDLAKLPEAIIAAFPSIREVKEVHARQLKPLLKVGDATTRMLAEAETIVTERAGGAKIEAPLVLRRLKGAAGTQKKRRPRGTVFRRHSAESGVRMRKSGKKVTLEFDNTMSEAGLRAALDKFLLQWKK